MEVLKKYWIAIPFGICMFVKPVLCILFPGTLSAYFGFKGISFLNKISSTGIERVGKIMAFESDREDDEEHETPVMEYSTLSGELIKGKPSFYVSSSFDNRETNKKLIGTNVSILYDKDEIEKFVVKNEQGLNYSMSRAMLAIGILLNAVCIGYLLSQAI